MSARTLTIKENILEANEEKAKVVRNLLDAHHVLMMNMMSSSGSGKTTVSVLLAGVLDQLTVADDERIGSASRGKYSDRGRGNDRGRAGDKPWKRPTGGEPTGAGRYRPGSPSGRGKRRGR